MGGIYRVNERMVQEAHDEIYASHPALLGCQIAFMFEKETGKPAFMVNSPATDEMRQIARLTGIKGVYRICYSHALNQKEAARRYAESVGKAYEDLNLIVCHIGGGISVTAHEKGKMVDSNDILNGDGPMAPTRTGSIPAVDMIHLSFSGKTEKELMKFVRSQGGLSDHLGTDVYKRQAQINAAGDHSVVIQGPGAMGHKERLVTTGLYTFAGSMGCDDAEVYTGSVETVMNASFAKQM